MEIEIASNTGTQYLHSIQIKNMQLQMWNDDN